jgi:RNA polymerase sigma-70 factor, ECF subfamily
MRRIINSHGWPAWKKIISCCHTQNGWWNRYGIRVMLNSGGAAYLAVAENMLASATDEATGPMTLGERVHALFEQLHTPVFRFLLRKTQNAEYAEDLTQETFLRLHKHLQEDRPLDNPKAWLFTVANNLAIDMNRSQSHVKDVDEIAWKQIEESRPGRQADPEKVILQRERLDRLHIAVLNLTALQRQCLHLRAEGLRYREIAELLDISISTVVDAVRRAALKLARDFEGEVSA